MLGLTITNISRLLKDKTLIVAVIMVPVFIIALTSVIDFAGNTKPSLSVTDQDNSTYSKSLIDVLSKQYTVSLMPEEEAYSDVRQGYTIAALIIPSGFFHDDAQKVEIVRVSGRIDARLEVAVNHFIDSHSLINPEAALPSVTLERNFTPKHSPFALNFIINFIFYCSSFIIVGEINDLKRWRLLSRIFTTPNSSRAILGSILLALFAILFMQFLAIAAASTFTSFSFMSNLLGSTLLFASYIFLVLGVGVLIGRFVSNNNVVPVVINVIIAPLGIMSGTMIPRQFTPDYITRFDFLTPQYWVYNGVESLSTAGISAVLPNVVILLLMGLCCFTAGAFRFAELVEQ